jgi:hypothetical protein
LILASSVAVAQSGDSDGDGVPDDIENATQRTVVAVALGDSFDIQSRLASAPYEDQFEVFYKAGNFSLMYERAGGGESSYTLELRNLVEWIDNGSHTFGGSEVVAVSPLGPTAFGGMAVTQFRTDNADGGVVNIFVVHSRTGEVTLNVTVAERFMRLGDRVLTPMEVKLNLTVNRVFVAMNANPNLALDWRITTDDGWEFADRSWDEENGFARDDMAVNVTGGPRTNPATVFFSWARSAVADGRPIPVAFVSAGNVTPNGSELYFAYPIASAQASVRLFHDPVLGVDSAAYSGIISRQPALQGDVVLYGVSLAAMLVLVAVTIVLANRRRKKREESDRNP